MEHGKSSKFDSKITENANPSPNNAENTSEERQVRELGKQDPYMPTANVVRIMRQILPAHAKISDDAKEIIQVCISEYISFITSEANHLCQSEKRKTITAEDVLWAMEKLGFDDYIHPLTVFLHRYRNQNNLSSLPGETSSVKRTAADCGPPIGLPPTPAVANYGPSFPMGPNLSTWFSDPMGMGGSSSEGAGVSSSQNDSAQFDFLTYLQSLRKQ